MAKYLIAWLLGVPAIVLLIIYLLEEALNKSSLSALI